MPRTEVIFYCEADGTAPAKVWLEGLNKKKIRPKCISYVHRLRDFGYELRRPTADYLRDDIHELRATYMNVHYRILYFFNQGMAVLVHGCTKEGKVGERDIDKAVERKRRFLTNPERHTYNEPD